MNWQDYYPYFQRYEFECKCGCGQAEMTKKHMDMLFRARLSAGIPFHITSGFRCWLHNRSEAVGSDDSSEHPLGHGSDVRALNSWERFIIIKSLFDAGFKRIGPNFDRLFVHCGTSPDHPQNVLFPY